MWHAIFVLLKALVVCSLALERPSLCTIGATVACSSSKASPSRYDNAELLVTFRPTVAGRCEVMRVIRAAVRNPRHLTVCVEDSWPVLSEAFHQVLEVLLRPLGVLVGTFAVENPGLLVDIELAQTATLGARLVEALSETSRITILLFKSVMESTFLRAERRYLRYLPSARQFHQ